MCVLCRSHRICIGGEQPQAPISQADEELKLSHSCAHQTPAAATTTLTTLTTLSPATTTTKYTFRSQLAQGQQGRLQAAPALSAEEAAPHLEGEGRRQGGHPQKGRLTTPCPSSLSVRFPPILSRLPATARETCKCGRGRSASEAGKGSVRGGPLKPLASWSPAIALSSFTPCPPLLHRTRKLPVAHSLVLVRTTGP